MAASTFNVVVGSEVGFVKAINLSKQTWSNLNEVKEANRSNEICCMCWGNSSQTQVCVAHRDRHVTVCDFGISSGSASKLDHRFDRGEFVIKSITKIDDSFLTAYEDGVVRLWKEEPVDIKAGGKLDVMVMKKGETHMLVTGGKENDLKLWDLNKPESPIFQAKNVRNDWLNLRVPVWIRCADFVKDGNIVTGTAHKQVRMYDPRVQRRPVMDLTFDEHPITALSTWPAQQELVVVGNSQGEMALIDIRGKGKVEQKYKGAAGAIRSIQCHSSQPLVASCGLDRYVRVHDLHSRALLQKLYLKSRLNCLLFADRAALKDDEDKDDSDGAEEEESGQKGEEGSDAEDVWDAMEET